MQGILSVHFSIKRMERTWKSEDLFLCVSPSSDVALITFTLCTSFLCNVFLQYFEITYATFIYNDTFINKKNYFVMCELRTEIKH